MAGIFTRPKLAEIMSNDALTPEERTDQVFSLYGRALDDGYVTKAAAKAAQDSALEQARTEWEKSQPKPNVQESDEYKALRGEFDSYRAMQTARASEDYSTVKPKFFETVYGLIDHSEGAKPVSEQMVQVREKYEEYFNAPTQQDKPLFGSQDKGTMPKGESGAAAEFARLWGFTPQTKG